MIYEQGFKNYVLCNMPPEHAKSMTVSIDYVTYRIVTDPNVRIKLVSKTQQMAKEFLYAVKQRLTSPQWIELQRRYAPVEGFKATAEKWTQDAIYIERDSGEKDPTLQALGIGGQIYGARADLIILDDCVTHKIDTKHLKATAEAPTSYTDVMTVESTGRRTFFHQRGANALLDVWSGDGEGNYDMQMEGETGMKARGRIRTPIEGGFVRSRYAPASEARSRVRSSRTFPKLMPVRMSPWTTTRSLPICLSAT